MKSVTKSLYVAIVACTIASCSTPLKVTSDYDKAANFAGYKTFTIDTLKASQSVSRLNQARIINAVKSELVKKGFMENTSDPDLLVNIATILQDKKSVTANTNYYSYGGMYRPYAWDGTMGINGYTTYNVQNYKDGSLIIDIADARTKGLIWEGIGNKELDKPLKDPETEIPAGIASIMKNFPPGK